MPDQTDVMTDIAIVGDGRAGIFSARLLAPLPAWFVLPLPLLRDIPAKTISLGPQPAYLRAPGTAPAAHVNPPAIQCKVPPGFKFDWGDQ